MKNNIMGTLTALAPTVMNMMKEVIGSKKNECESPNTCITNYEKLVPAVEGDKRNINFIFNVNVYINPYVDNGYVNEEYEY